MTKQKLYVLCGPPGSGKSTWAKQFFSTYYLPHQYKIISRDDIRFALLDENDEYFSKENQVFIEYINQIQSAIDSGVLHIVCDATHINTKSREKLLNNLDLSKIDCINMMCIMPSLNTCLERNEMRQGRQKVPRGIVRRMYFNFENPKEDVKYSDKYRIYYFFNEVNNNEQRTSM